jgi:hypothetical protein
MRKSLLISISGVAAARTKPLYEALNVRMPTAMPDSKIAFIGCPYYIKGRRKFPLPLLWGKEERDEHPTTRLLNAWKRLNQRSVTDVRASLATHDIVVVERFGLDALLYATACCDSPEAIDEAERVHHALVSMRVVAQGIRPPTYFIPAAPIDDIRPLAAVYPEVQEMDGIVVRNFLEHEARMLARYFDPKHGQNKPCLLPITMSIDDMCECVIDTVRGQVAQQDAA